MPLTDIQQLVEELPPTTPRFVLLTYPMETEDNRKINPLVLIYYRPVNATQSNRMAYAGAIELVRNESGVSK
jgi:hypothetical protein